MTIPSNVRMPFAYVEFNPRARGSTPLQYQCLLIGQKLTSGTASAGTRYQVNSADHAGQLFGYGSVLHRQALYWFKNNTFTKLYAFALADDGSGVARARTWTLSGSTISAGTLAMYISGVRYAVTADGVSDTPTTLASRLKDVINRDAAVMFTAANTAGALTLTAKNKGTLANSVDVRFNLLDGDVYPTGLTVTAGSPTAGATDPDDTTIIALLGEDWYNIIVNPYTANLAAWDAELNDRFGALRQIDGRLFTSIRDTYSNTVTAGLSYNSKNIRLIHCIDVPSSPLELASVVAAISAREGEVNPARQLTDLEMVGIVAPVAADKLMLSENNSLLYSGVSVHVPDPVNKVRIARIISTYRLNDASAPDTSYLDDCTMAVLSYLRYDLRNQLWTEFHRAILVDDGNPTDSDGVFVTPSMIKAKCVLIFRQWQLKGYVENAAQFIADLSVTRDDTDKTRVNISLSPDLSNPLMVMGVNIRFFL